MTKTVTDRMLRQALNQITKNNIRTVGTSSFNDENIVHSIQEKIVNKVNGSTLICSDGTEAELLSPAPCIHWKCISNNIDDNGIITLNNPIGALIVTSDQVNYCLGLIGSSNEFEIRFQVGKNEIRVNNSFININSDHIVINGTELKKEVNSE